MSHTIKPIHTLTRDERRELAEAAAENCQHLHDACPFEAGTPEQLEFQDDYLHRRRALIPACA